MNIIIPKQSEIWFTCCTMDGKNNDAPNCPSHFFIILSKEGYNKKSTSVLGVPLSSYKELESHDPEEEKRRNDFRINYGLDLANDEIDGIFMVDKKTFVMCDRPCRIDKLDMKYPTEGLIIPRKMDEITDSIGNFLKQGRIIKELV